MTTLQKGLFLFLTIFMVIIACCVRYINVGQKQQLLELQQKITVLEDTYDRTQKRFYNVSLSAYAPIKAQTDSDPFITASMTKIKPGHTAAVSRDLVPFLMGRKIYIEGKGVWTVQDVMHKRFTNSVDLCLATEKQASDFGRKSAMVVIINEEKAVSNEMELFLKDIRPLFSLPDGTNLMDTGTRKERQDHIKAIEHILDYTTAFSMLLTDAGCTEQTLDRVNKSLKTLQRPALQIGQKFAPRGD